jgi:hydroxyacylglutathione hydrolase
MTLKYETIVNGPFQENCFLLWDEASKDAAFIDPGDEPDRLLARSRSLGLKVKAIFNTHAHLDHAGAVAAIQKELGAPFALHPKDEFLLAQMPAQARMFGLPPMEIPTLDRHLAHDDTIEVGGCTARVLHTPGHTPGGVCFEFDEVIFVGDTLFAGSIGRTDLPGGSLDEILASIKERLLVLGDDLVVETGHGPPTKIAVERVHNPFLNGRF